MSMRTNAVALAAILTVGMAFAAAVPPVDEWINDFTGSLPYPSQHGDPGWPGYEPGQHPDMAERIPYPGSVEHVRMYWQHYMPIVPLYNAKTLLKVFPAGQIAALGKKGMVEYAEPIYRVGTHGDAVKTEYFNKPVKVARWTGDTPPLKLDLGRLPQGVYVVRVIAATPTANVERMSQRLVINFAVNDGLGGEQTLYRKRCAAIDEFYSIVEFFFMAPEKRRYEATMSVDASTRLPELMLHSIDLHDKLAQLPQRAGKRTASFYDADERAAGWRASGTWKADERDVEERLADDARLWAAGLPLNAQIFGGGDGQGAWDSLARAANLLVPPDVEDDGMGIDFYGAEMLWNRPAEELEKLRATPRMGYLVNIALKIAKDNPGLTRHTAYPAAEKFEQAYRQPFNAIKLSKEYHESGDEVKARQGAVHLARLGLQLTTFGFRQTIRTYDMIPSTVHGDCAFRRRYKEMYYQSRNEYDSKYENFITAYDRLFPYIKDNAELAASLGRFIPWIKNTADMQRFYETFVLQYYAHQVMTYNAYLNDPTPGWMANVMAVQQDPAIVGPWAEWLLRYVFVYPNRPRGADELLINAINRDGTNLRGSTFYAMGGNELDTVIESFAICAKAGLQLPVDMSDRNQFPKAHWGKRFRQDMAVAGGYMFYIGDVSSPNRPRLQEFTPAMLKELGGVPNNPSRVLSDWGGILETGREFDDFRQRRALGVRTGFGYGHHHSDPLDLQIWAHGVSMCGDGGARVGYAVPDTSWLGNHNTVFSDLIKHGQQQWVAAFAPQAGAQYLRAAVQVDGRYERQVALIDVDERNSYVVDVFRVKGGAIPAYAFHAMPADLFEQNAIDCRAAPDMAELKHFLPQESKWRGVAPAALTATWRMRREPETLEWTNAKGEKGSLQVPGVERRQLALSGAFDEESPRKSIRLRLLGHKGGEVYGATALCLQVTPYDNNNLYLRPASWNGETVFVAVYEPYAAATFVQEARLLVADEALGKVDAQVAIEVTLANGRRDLIFMAPPGAGDMTVEGVTTDGEFAYFSLDGDGVRQTALVGGTKLHGHGAALHSAVAFYSGTVKAVDYRALTVDLGQALPPDVANAVVEVAVPGRPTNVTLNGVTGEKAQLLKGLDFAMSRVTGFSEAGLPRLQAPITVVPGMTVTDDAGQTFWKFGNGAHNGNMVLENGPAPSVTLKPGEALRVWEIGPGDPWRLPVQKNAIRGADGKMVY